MFDEEGGKRKVSRGVSYVVVAVLAFIAGISVAGGPPASVASRVPLLGDGLDATPDQSADLADFWKAWHALEDNFVETHASSTLPSRQERIFGAISGLADSYDDPHTVFFPPEEAKIFADNISGSFTGVGMELGMRDHILTVVAPLKGTPADRAGVKSGDLIIAIDGESTDGISIDAAVHKIRGPIGTTVTLTLVRDGTPLDLEIVRGVIEIPETEDGLDTASGVYRIALYEFTGNSPGLFARALARFISSGTEKLIIDLRGNPGGYLDAAVDIAGHFIHKGAPVVIEDSGDPETSNTHVSPGYDDLPKGTKIVVLIDGGSASASEILAGALQDNDIATIIGEQSFGKGSVQTLVPIDGGSLKVTVARWVTPAGHWIMGNGITPDIEVAFTKEDIEIGHDPQIARAIKYLTTGK